MRPSSKSFQLENNETGIAQLVQVLIKIEPELIVLEGSAYAQSAARRLRSESFCGGMEINAAVKLTEAGLAVAIINPRQARDFAKATVLAHSLAPVGGQGFRPNVCEADLRREASVGRSSISQNRRD